MSLSIQGAEPAEIRALCRNSAFAGQTAGLANGYVQANLMIVPAEYAFDFLLFCQRNPKPCPLIEVLEPGCFAPVCAKGADLRTDVPGYCVYRNGVLAERPENILAYWRDDLVGFMLGCSFSFEDALMREGISLRHVDQKKNVAMYKTNLACHSAGCMRGNMVVSMRPIRAVDVSRAVQITARYPRVHGAPVHIGFPQGIGIADLSKPDFGDPVPIMDDELPVFWACGVTPQYIAELSRLPFCITHSPGKMLITDLKNEEFAQMG